MAVSAEFRDFISEQLEAFGPVDIRRMFGGAGVFRAGLMFGLITDDALYFKVDDGNKADYEAAGTGPFVYEKKGREMSLAYWRVPEGLLDEADELAEWAHKAFNAAIAADRLKPKSKQKYAP